VRKLEYRICLVERLVCTAKTHNKARRIDWHSTTVAKGDVYNRLCSDDSFRRHDCLRQLLRHTGVHPRLPHAVHILLTASDSPKNRNITTDKCVTVRATCAMHIQTGCSRRRAVLPVGQTKVFNLFGMFVHCIRCNRPIKVRRSLIALVDRKCNRQLQTNLRTALLLLRGHFTIISHLSPSKF
jgi:hypothetical protein